MFRPLPIFIGLRYTGAKRRNHFISFISFFSMAGIALGITALITVISVMNGFEQELRSRILGMAAHATVYGLGSELKDWEQAKAVADKHPRVLGTAPFVQREAMLVHGKQVSGVMVRGVLPSHEPSVSQVVQHFVDGELGSLKDGEFNIVLGAELASFLGVTLGDKVTLISPQAMATAAGVVPRLRRFVVTGIYEVGMYEYDRGMSLIHMGDAQRLFRMKDGVSGVRLLLDDVFRARSVSREVAINMPGVYRIRDWTQEHANFFKAIATEKIVMFVILFLIVAVAAFNIVSTLVMVVTDKRADIAILRTLGLSPMNIMGVFIVQGILIGFIGMIIGVAAGLALASNVESIVPALEGMLGVQFLPPDVYYISDLPSEVRTSDVVKIAGLSFVITVIATLYPAWKASTTQPAEALRYE